MIFSMTAYARQATEDRWGNIVWELRSVNHRYLEITFRLPEQLRNIEMACREQIQNKIKRGKIEAVLRYQPGTELPFEFSVNHSVIDQLSKMDQQIAEKFCSLKVDLLEILSWQGVLNINETHMNAVGSAAVVNLEHALEKLTAMRAGEGKNLTQFLLEQLQPIRQQINNVNTKIPKVIQYQRQRLIDRFQEIQLQFDKERLEQEMLFLAQKADVTEELQRLTVHLNEVERILKQGGVIGRRLDFLMQELNREANTLGSKSIDADVTQAAVEMKVIIEQMREQVQNIE